MATQNQLKQTSISEDGNFVVATHIAQFRVSDIFAHKAVGPDGNVHHDAPDDFVINYNGVAIRLKPSIAWQDHVSYYPNHQLVQRFLCPELRIYHHSHGKTEIEGKARIFVVNSIDCARAGLILELPAYGAKHTYYKNCYTSICGSDGPCLPRSISDLSRYFINNRSTLAIKYELKIHRSFFDVNKAPVNQIVPPIYNQPSKFDRSEFEELNVEVKDGNRFLLEANDGTRFCAHKNRLKFASDYFKGMFRGNPQNQQYNEAKAQKLKMNDLSGNGLRQVLAFIYLGKFEKELAISSTVEIAKAADKYLIHDLKTLCRSKLLKFASLSTSVGQIVEYLWLSHGTNMPELKKMCMNWLRDHWYTVKGEVDVKELMNDEEGREIIWELLDFMSKKC